VANRSARTLEPADRRRLFTALDAWARESIVGRRLRAMVVLANGAALTLDETLNVRVGDFLNDHTLRLRLQGAIAVVPAHCKPALDDWFSAVKHRKGKDLVFGLRPELHFPDRTVQYQFTQVQRRARLAAKYRFTDLRHDALHAFGTRTRSVDLVMQFGRIRERWDADRFVPAASPVSLDELAKLANRSLV
jgi:hypothetical protein